MDETAQKPYIYEEEAEQASFAYLMTTLIVIVGLPMPIINVIGSVFFYLANRKKASYFVRFHSLQSMLSQLCVVPINAVGVSWTIAVIIGQAQISDYYVAYIITIVAFNILEFVSSVYAAVQVRKKADVRFWLFGPMTELIYKSENK
ncbi:MAG: DUF4870 domain-containing protein [Candidatus Symbiothrix sp.]|jgi:uncharacterized membrane protein|nr:DUF4870 domain-containing protein [Candidatus Symbiothrix sp.]